MDFDFLDVVGDGPLGRIFVFVLLGILAVASIVVGIGSETTILQVSRIGTGVLILVATGLFAWMHRPNAEKASCLVLLLVFGFMILSGLAAFFLFFFGEFVNDVWSQFND